MARIRLGRPNTSTESPTHTRGQGQGNSPGNYERQVGHLPDDRSTAERSTGVNARARNPIMPGMPNLSPP
jgi:hypothetical protein